MRQTHVQFDNRLGLNISSKSTSILEIGLRRIGAELRQCMLLHSTMAGDLSMERLVKLSPVADPIYHVATMTTIGSVRTLVYKASLILYASTHMSSHLNACQVCFSFQSFWDRNYRYISNFWHQKLSTSIRHLWHLKPLKRNRSSA